MIISVKKDSIALPVLDRTAMEWPMWMVKITFLIYAMPYFLPRLRFLLLGGWFLHTSVWKGQIHLKKLELIESFKESPN